MNPPDITRSTTRFSFWTNMAAIGVVCLVILSLPPSPVDIHTLSAFTLGYGTALLVCGALLIMRDAWFRHDENSIGELTKRQWSLVQCSNGQWSVLDRDRHEISMDPDWKNAIQLALMVEQESGFFPNDI